MSKISTLAAMAACIATITNTSAQTNLLIEIDKFTNSKENAQYITYNGYQESSRDNQEAASYCSEYKFDMPIEMTQKVLDLCDAFETDTTAAYRTFIKEAGDNSGETMNVVYGQTLRNSVIFGSRYDRNYMAMLVRDKVDSLSRYCYALTWHIDAEAERLRGSIFTIHGKDPSRVSANLSPTRFKLSTRLSAEAESSDYSLIGIDPRVLHTSRDSIRTDTDFLQRFANLKYAYMEDLQKQNIDNKGPLMAGLASKMLDLCRSHGSLLNKREKDFCSNSIKEMINGTADTFLEGILNEAIYSLNK